VKLLSDTFPPDRENTLRTVKLTGNQISGELLAVKMSDVHRRENHKHAVHERSTTWSLESTSTRHQTQRVACLRSDVEHLCSYLNI